MADKEESRNLVLFVGNLPLRYLPTLHVTTSQQTPEHRTPASSLAIPGFLPINFVREGSWFHCVPTASSSLAVNDADLQHGTRRNAVRGRWGSGAKKSRRVRTTENR